MVHGLVDVWQRQENSLFSRDFKAVLGLVCPLQRLKMAIFLEGYRKGCEFHYFNPVPSLKMRGVIPPSPNIFTSGVFTRRQRHFTFTFPVAKKLKPTWLSEWKTPRLAFLYFTVSALWTTHSTRLSPQHVPSRRNVFLLQLLTVSFFGFTHLYTLCSLFTSRPYCACAVDVCVAAVSSVLIWHPFFALS